MRIATNGFVEELESKRLSLIKKNRIKISRHNCHRFPDMLVCAEEGFDSIEMDSGSGCVTSDGIPVVNHGATVGGLTIANETLATLKNATKSKYAPFGELSIPTAEEYIRFAHFLDVDLVVNVGGAQEENNMKVYRLINKYGMQERSIILTGTDTTSLQSVAEVCPHARVYSCVVGTPNRSTLDALEAAMNGHTQFGMAMQANVAANLTWYASVEDEFHEKGLEAGFFYVTSANFANVCNFHPYYIGTDESYSTISDTINNWVKTFGLQD